MYSLAAAAPDVIPLNSRELADDIRAMTPDAVRAGRIGGLRFLPHRITWQALIYDHAVQRELARKRMSVGGEHAPRRWLLAGQLFLCVALFLVYPSVYALKLAFTDAPT